MGRRRWPAAGMPVRRRWSHSCPPTDARQDQVEHLGGGGGRAGRGAVKGWQGGEACACKPQGQTPPSRRHAPLAQHTWKVATAMEPRRPSRCDTCRSAAERQHASGLPVTSAGAASSRASMRAAAAARPAAHQVVVPRKLQVADAVQLCKHVAAPHGDGEEGDEADGARHPAQPRHRVGQAQHARACERWEGRRRTSE